jgi:predicted MFS family arabinose efflux permease
MALGIAWRSLPLLLSRVVEGFFNGDIAIVQAMAADMSTARTKARSFARINIGMNLGWVVGPMIGGYAAVVSGDYSLAAWLAVGMTVINLLLVLWLLPNRPVRRPGMRFSRPANCCCNLVSCPTCPDPGSYGRGAALLHLFQCLAGGAAGWDRCNWPRPPCW